MNKIFLIIQREFLSRVKKKSFLVATILVPLIFPAIIGGIAYFMSQEEKNAEAKVIQVVDESGTFDVENSSDFEFIEIDRDVEVAKEAFLESDDYGLLYIPEYTIEDPSGFILYAKSNPSIATINNIEDAIEGLIRDKKLTVYNVDEEMLNKLKTNVDITSINLSETGEKESDAGVSFGIGYVTGFLIYIFMFVYGGQVMQGVIEEKSSKIVEIIVSTVKPFQLMLGKILGVASVGIFQILIWIVLVGVLSSVVLGMFGFDAGSTQTAVSQAGESPEAMKFMSLLENIPFTRIILLFVFYFIGGYLLYGSLFAAVGSAVDNPAEAQQFMFPITVPLIAGIIGMTSIIQNPDGAVAFWLSIIPFTSPIAMMGRIGFGVPLWELALSMLLLVLGFIFTVWLAGRIYRVGILMHGTKVNYKVLTKWFMMKN